MTVQRRVTNERKSVKQVQYCCYVNLNLSFFAVLVAFSSSLLQLPNIPEETSTLTKMQRSKVQFLPLPRFPSLLEWFYLTTRETVSSQNGMLRTITHLFHCLLLCTSCVFAIFVSICFKVQVKSLTNKNKVFPSCLVGSVCITYQVESERAHYSIAKAF